MADYDIAFLDLDWDGAGFDFEFYCQFTKNSFNLHGLRKFFKTISERFKFADFTYADLPADPKYKTVDLEALNAGNLKLMAPPTFIIVWLEDDEVPDLRFFIRMYDRSILELGAEPEYYYSGSRSEDRRRAGNLVDLLFLARNSFGDAATDFAANGYVERLVAEKISNKDPANLTKHSDKAWWVDEVLRKCEETRPSS